jgi:hypothetical protein
MFKGHCEHPRTRTDPSTIDTERLHQVFIDHRQKQGDMDMKELDLTVDAQRRLWQCYSLLLRLAEEAEQNTAADSELCERQESATATEANESTRHDNDTSKLEPGQTKSELTAQTVTVGQIG